MAPKRKQSNEERLKKKREAEKRRQDKIKLDPDLYQKEQEKNRGKYLKRIAKGQICPIAEQTAREQRKRRKQWKANSKNYRSKTTMEDLIPENDPITLSPGQPNATNDAVIMPGSANGTASNSKKTSGRKKVRKDRAAAYRSLKKSQEEVKRYKTKYEKYKKKYYRSLKAVNPTTPTTPASESPRTSTKRILKGTRVSATIKRKLFVAEVVRTQLIESYNLLQNKHSSKQLFRKVISGKIIKKYRCLTDCKEFFKQAKKNISSALRFERKKYTTFQGRPVATHVMDFLQLDISSRLCPGKRDTITRKGMKKQKRFLNDSLKILHAKFLTMHVYKISYSLFCKLRPFWVCQPSVSERDTCLCVLHSNTKMLVERLYSSQVIESKSPSDLIKELCCSGTNGKCLLRQCDTCINNGIAYKLFNKKDSEHYKQWLTKKEKRICKGKEIVVQLTSKDLVQSTKGEMVNILEEIIVKYMTHVANIYHQFNAIDNLKANLTESQILIHVDFSENFSCKYAEEAQSVHFGASREQVTLHTGVYYYNKNGTTQTASFCTLSKSLRHDPSAICAHLLPILEDVKVKFPGISTLHFLSDGPTTQYRNRKMFYLLASYIPAVTGVSEITWNYSEAGHGKGAPDGIGAVLKRTADRLVAEGKDVANFNSLYNVLKERCRGVQLFHIPEDMITNVDQVVEGKEVKPFVGTMKVHQATWSSNKSNSLSFRSLSCFDCENGETCCHYNVGKKLWTFGIEEQPDSPTSALDDSSTELIGNEQQAVRTYKTGEWVVVNYDEVLYPGEVVHVTTGEVTVKVMKPAGNKNFKWPAKPDVLNYMLVDVVKTISPPIPCRSRATQFFFENFP